MSGPLGFVVTRRFQCAECGGAGFVQSRIAPDGEECGMCHGSGVVESVVELVAACHELGIPIGESA